MTKDKLLKELERLKNESGTYSNNNSINTGYYTAILDAIDLVKKCSIPHNRQSTFTSTSIEVENMQGVGKIGNAYGQLYVKEENSKYYWCIDCDVNGMVWEEIPEYLYQSLMTYQSQSQAKN